jgi:hypothetical protein
MGSVEALESHSRVALWLVFMMGGQELVEKRLGWSLALPNLFIITSHSIVK